MSSSIPRDDIAPHLSLAQLATILGGVADGVIVTGADGRVRFVNDAAAQIARFVGDDAFRRTPFDALVGRYDFFDASGDPVSPADLPTRQALRGQAMPETVLRVRDRATGRAEWWAVRVTVLRGDRDTTEAVVAMFRDITAERSAAETVRDSERRFRALIEHSADVIAVVDPRGVVQYVSDSIERMLGYHPDEFIGTNCFAAIHPDDVSALREVLGGLLTTPGASVTAEYRLRHKDGVWRWAEATATNLLDEPSVRGIVGNFHDITKRREAEEERQRFIAMIAHELRNPLTAIAGYAGLMQRRERYDPRAVARIAEQAKRLERLSLDLREAVRFQAGVLSLHRAPVDVPALLTGVVEQVQATTTAHVIHAAIPPALPTALWDADRVAQVLGNLLHNAVVYSPGGGDVLLRAEDIGGALRITVTDHGVGIPAEALPHIFEPFYRAANATDSTTKGMGLGLPIAKSLVEAHGGQFHADSTPGVGTTFTVNLPYAPTP